MYEPEVGTVGERTNCLIHSWYRICIMCNTCKHRSLRFDVKHTVIHVFGHLSQKSRNLSQEACMHTLCVLHETFGNSIGTTMKHADCRNYIGKI